MIREKETLRACVWKNSRNILQPFQLEYGSVLPPDFWTHACTAKNCSTQAPCAEGASREYWLGGSSRGSKQTWPRFATLESSSRPANGKQQFGPRQPLPSIAGGALSTERAGCDKCCRPRDARQKNGAVLACYASLGDTRSTPPVQCGGLTIGVPERPLFTPLATAP